MAELIDLITSNFDYDNFFSAKLTAPLTATDTDIFLDAIPTPDEGVLVIDWDVADSREVIFYNSKTASKVVVPSTAERGFDDSTATTHLSGANVIYAPVRALFRLSQQLATTSTAAWKPLGYVPNTVTDVGGRHYELVFNSVDLTSFLSVGMKTRIDPTTAQPTRCTSLNGTTQYYSKTSPAATTFTDDFVCAAWIKPNNNPSATEVFLSRFDGTSGWWFGYDTLGQVILNGANAGASNYRRVTSYSTLLDRANRWTHVAALLDMSANTAVAATAETAKSWIMFDGIEQPAVAGVSGTSPSALIQAGTLNVGALNGASFFDGKLAQVWYSNTRITQANVRLLKNQSITMALCTTHNIVSAYSFDNSINDINTTNANNLTAQGSAVATEADSPYGLDGSGVPGAYESAAVTKISFATNTTVTLHAPEGCAIPTSGSITGIEYSTEYAPYGYRGVQNSAIWTSNSMNGAIFTPTNSSQNLDTTNLVMTAYAAVASRVMVTVRIGIGSTADYEFNPQIRLGGTVIKSGTPSAAIGSAGGRANVRTITFPLLLSAGVNIISAGVNISSGSSLSLAANGGQLLVSAIDDKVYVG